MKRAVGSIVPLCCLPLLVLSLLAASAQQAVPGPGSGLGPGPGSGSGPVAAASADLQLAVVVTGKHDARIERMLPESAFTLLDNGVPQPIKTFRHLGGDAPVRVLIVVDAVNANYTTVAYERDRLDKYLSANNGELPRPTAVALLTDKGLQVQPNVTQDGKSLMAALDQQTTGLRTIGRSSGFYGAEERLDLSLTALRTLIAEEGKMPGRTLMVLISPGWALFSGPRIELSQKQQRGIFAQLVSLTRQLQQANITLYAVDPRGTGESIESRFYYREFLKGVAEPKQTDFADLSLQVLATHSGGLVLNANNNIDELVKRAVDDAAQYYEITFVPAPGEHPDEYHSLEIKLPDSGLSARTRQGYYAEPLRALPQ